MKRKTWALASLALLLAAIAAICLTVIVIDPFQVYRPATRYLPPIDRTTQVYANAGVARSYAYDSAVVGTPVTENFRPSQMDSLLGGRFIKLCTSAGTAYNHALLMDLAFRTHDMRRIVYGLDVYSFIARLDQTGSDVPLYLYDDSLLNDVSYWLNRSVLATFLPRCLSAWGQKQDDSIRDSMYCWAGQACSRACPCFPSSPTRRRNTAGKRYRTAFPGARRRRGADARPDWPVPAGCKRPRAADFPAR